MAFHEIKATDISHLTPAQIGYRLWTTYQLLDASLGNIPDGTTASTTVYDGKNNLITATLADAAAFAAVYDADDQLLGVVRLNSITHKPDNPEEQARIEKAGNYVFVGRVRGILAVSRAIGDRRFRGVSADAQIDKVSFDALAEQLGADSKSIAKVQVFSTCDGFTDGAGEAQTKANHEVYLSSLLQRMNAASLRESELAEKLAKQAIADGSGDNVSVAVQTITPGQQKPTVQGIYDGHGGKKAAHYAAKNMFSVFQKQCRLSHAAYAAEAKSIFQAEGWKVFFRDHPIEELFDAEMRSQLSDLITLKTFTASVKAFESEEEKAVFFRLYFEGLLSKVDSLSGDLKAADKQVAIALRDSLSGAATDFFNSNVPSADAYKTFKVACDEAITKARPTLEKYRGWADFFAKLVLTIVTLGTVPLLLSGYNKTKTGCFGYSLFPAKGEQIIGDVGEVVKDVEPKGPSKT